MSRYVFVGERRSPKAQAMNVTWEDGRLCAKNLFEALRAVGIEPSRQVFLNAFADDARLDADSLAQVEEHAARGLTVVALGRLASDALRVRGVWHLRLIHPAARGSIRKTERYREHVRSRLSGGCHA